jgi:hypothetical protein
VTVAATPRISTLPRLEVDFEQLAGRTSKVRWREAAPG